jgi:peptidoglycan/LPS O-acetylase OafA/YrhL
MFTTHRAPGASSSYALVDALKALACCLIVLHHLAFYGPMADHADDLFPRTFDWLAQHARLAVQVFLVIGGYLAARGVMSSRFLAVDGSGPTEPVRPSGTLLTDVWRPALRRIAQRFVRLALPLWAALVVAVACNALADHWMDHHSISAPPGFTQFLMHLLLLQDLTGHEALSAGIWYVAIDFQLFAVLMLLAALSRMLVGDRGARMGLAWATLTGLAVSAFFINRDSSWDDTAAYFWVSYGLGVLLGLGVSWRWMVNALGLLLIALWVDPRVRLWVAGGTVTALWLWVLARGRVLPAVAPWVQGLSRISYAVFLVHFPVSLVVNALWAAFIPPNPWLHLLGVVIAFKLSVLLGAAFHAFVEQPLVDGVNRLMFSGRGRAAAST